MNLDPVFWNVPAHITLQFPFALTMSEVLAKRYSMTDRILEQEVCLSLQFPGDFGQIDLPTSLSCWGLNLKPGNSGLNSRLQTWPSPCLFACDAGVAWGELASVTVNAPDGAWGLPVPEASAWMCCTHCWFDSISDFLLISIFSPSSFIPSFPLPLPFPYPFFSLLHRPHSPHHRAARQYPKALCSVWKIFSGILQSQR